MAIILAAYPFPRWFSSVEIPIPLSSISSRAQAPSTAPVRILYGFPAGSSGDIVARRVAERIAGTAYTDVPAIVENKHLDAALAMAKLIQEQLPPRRRNLNEPSRRSQGAHMFPDAQSPREEPVKRKRGRPPLPRLTPIEAVRRQLESM